MVLGRKRRARQRLFKCRNQAATYTQPISLDEDNHAKNICVHPKETPNYQDNRIETNIDSIHRNLASTENVADDNPIPESQCIQPAHTINIPESRWKIGIQGQLYVPKLGTQYPVTKVTSDDVKMMK